MKTQEAINPLIDKISHETIREAVKFLANEIDLMRLEQDAKWQEMFDPQPKLDNVVKTKKKQECGTGKPPSSWAKK